MAAKFIPSLKSKGATHMNANRIQQALATLLRLIDNGMEYPDAHSEAGYRHGLVGRQYTLLTEAYDAHCQNFSFRSY